MTDHSVSCHRGTGNRTKRHNNQNLQKPEIHRIDDKKSTDNNDDCKQSCKYQHYQTLTKSESLNDVCLCTVNGKLRRCPGRYKSHQISYGSKKRFHNRDIICNKPFCKSQSDKHTQD